MSFSYKHESKIFFWILSVLFTSLLFSIFYYLKVFGDKYTNTIPFYLSFTILIVLIFVGFYSRKTTMFFYFIKQSPSFSKTLQKIDINLPEKDIEKMVTRYKEVFYNLDIGEKEKSIEIIQRTIGFSKDYAIKVYLIFKNIKRTRTILLFLGFFLSIIFYFLITYVDYFYFLKVTKFFILSIILMTLLLFYFKSLLFSDLPDKFYLNIIKVNQVRLTENKKEINYFEKILTEDFNNRENKKKDVKKIIFYLTQRGIKKQDIIDILNSKGISSYGLKDLIMQAEEDDSKIKIKTDLNEVSKNIDDIVESYKQIRDIDKKIIELKNDVDRLTLVQETIEKINSSDWDYYKNIKFKEYLKKDVNDKNISEEIYNQIHYKNELKESYEDILNNLYKIMLPYAPSLSKDKVSSILISKGYSYETVTDLLEKFKENKIDLYKNSKSLQERIVSSINSFYESFKD